MTGFPFSFQNLLEALDLTGKGIDSGAMGSESSSEGGLGERACARVCL